MSKEKKKDINYFRQVKEFGYRPPVSTPTNLEDGYYNVIFHYNPHKGLLYCISRDEYREYFNGEPCKTGVGNNLTEAYESYKKRNKIK